MIGVIAAAVVAICVLLCIAHIGLRLLSSRGGVRVQLGNGSQAVLPRRPERAIAVSHALRVRDGSQYRLRESAAHACLPLDAACWQTGHSFPPKLDLVRLPAPPFADEAGATAEAGLRRVDVPGCCCRCGRATRGDAATVPLFPLPSLARHRRSLLHRLARDGFCLVDCGPDLGPAVQRARDTVHRSALQHAPLHQPAAHTAAGTRVTSDWHYRGPRHALDVRFPLCAESPGFAGPAPVQLSGAAELAAPLAHVACAVLAQLLAALDEAGGAGGEASPSSSSSSLLHSLLGEREQGSPRQRAAVHPSLLRILVQGPPPRRRRDNERGGSQPGANTCTAAGGECRARPLSRALAHTDVGLLTVAPAASFPALQGLSSGPTRRGASFATAWLQLDSALLAAGPGAVVVFGGAALGAVTGGVVAPLVHRVALAAPTPPLTPAPRVSSPFFLRPAATAPLPGTDSNGASHGHAAPLTGEQFERRLRATRLVRHLPGPCLAWEDELVRAVQWCGRPSGWVGRVNGPAQALLDGRSPG